MPSVHEEAFAKNLNRLKTKYAEQIENGYVPSNQLVQAAMMQTLAHYLEAKHPERFFSLGNTLTDDLREDAISFAKELDNNTARMAMLYADNDQLEQSVAQLSTVLSQMMKDHKIQLATSRPDTQALANEIAEWQNLADEQAVEYGKRFEQQNTIFNNIFNHRLPVSDVDPEVINELNSIYHQHFTIPKPEEPIIEPQEPLENIVTNIQNIQEDLQEKIHEIDSKLSEVKEQTQASINKKLKEQDASIEGLHNNLTTIAYMEKMIDPIRDRMPLPPIQNIMQNLPIDNDDEQLVRETLLNLYDNLTEFSLTIDTIEPELSNAIVSQRDFSLNQVFDATDLDEMAVRNAILEDHENIAREARIGLSELMEYRDSMIIRKQAERPYEHVNAFELFPEEELDERYYTDSIHDLATDIDKLGEEIDVTIQEMSKNITAKADELEKRMIKHKEDGDMETWMTDNINLKTLQFVENVMEPLSYLQLPRASRILTGIDIPNDDIHEIRTRLGMLHKQLNQFQQNILAVAEAGTKAIEKGQANVEWQEHVEGDLKHFNDNYLIEFQNQCAEEIKSLLGQLRDYRAERLQEHQAQKEQAKIIQPEARDPEAQQEKRPTSSTVQYKTKGTVKQSSEDKENRPTVKTPRSTRT